MAKFTTILAIETSCDETAASVLRGKIDAKNPSFEILSSVVKSQIKLHAKFGGVVPEVAARAHTSAIRPVVEKAIADANIEYRNTKLETNSKFEIPNSTAYNLQSNIDLIAVTSGPGLIASLIVGVEFAKGLAFALNKKMIAVNHMEGHLYSPFGLDHINPQPATRNLRQFPILSLIVSGGHTMLVLQKNEAHYKVLGSTVDDAAGEAFDKVAKLIGLPYPGGPAISKLALMGNSTITFPRPMIHSNNFDSSFSGLKTAVLYHLENHYPSQRKSRKTERLNLHHFNFSHIPANDKANIARSFEDAVVDVLVAKTLRAAKKYQCQTIALSGGVAANKRLRAALQAASHQLPVNFIVPELNLCTDNAAMIAIAAYFKLRAGYEPVNFEKIQADSAWEI